MIYFCSIIHDYLCFTCVLLPALSCIIISILLTYFGICGFPVLLFLSALMSSQRSSEFVLLLCVFGLSIIWNFAFFILDLFVYWTDFLDSLPAK